MKAVSGPLLRTIIELQKLPAMASSYLAGGTNLALRYNHRISVDIDLFFSSAIGNDGMENIAKEVAERFKDNIQMLRVESDLPDECIFLRFFLKIKGITIKVDVLQNMKLSGAIEAANGVCLASAFDIGLFKLRSLSNRSSFKDVYDLDYLTDHIPLIDLYKGLSDKENTFNSATDRNLFDLDGLVSPVGNPSRLLEFQSKKPLKQGRPDHSHNKLDLMPEAKSWLLARSSWRRKVRELFNQLGLPFPESEPVN